MLAIFSCILLQFSTAGRSPWQSQRQALPGLSKAPSWAARGRSRQAAVSEQSSEPPARRAFHSSFHSFPQRAGARGNLNCRLCLCWGTRAVLLAFGNLFIHPSTVFHRGPEPDRVPLHKESLPAQKQKLRFPLREKSLPLPRLPES